MIGLEREFQIKKSLAYPCPLCGNTHTWKEAAYDSLKQFEDYTAIYITWCNKASQYVVDNIEPCSNT